jgi:hypothetical protein
MHTDQMLGVLAVNFALQRNSLKPIVLVVMRKGFGLELQVVDICFHYGDRGVGTRLSARRIGGIGSQFAGLEGGGTGLAGVGSRVLTTSTRRC